MEIERLTVTPGVDLTDEQQESLARVAGELWRHPTEIFRFRLAVPSEAARRVIAAHLSPKTALELVAVRDAFYARASHPYPTEEEARQVTGTLYNDVIRLGFDRHTGAPGKIRETRAADVEPSE